MSDDALLRDYFRGLFSYSQALLTRLPLRLTPQPVSYVAEILEAKVDQVRPEEVSRLLALGRPFPAAARGAGRPVGMNTIGILADRLSILAIKAWFLRRKHGKPEQATAIEQGDVEQVIAAMVEAQPGSSTLLGKVTALNVTLHNASWEESYFGLLTSNLLMWEAQESMYVDNLADQDDDHVRALLSWASFGNLRRNRYISSCEVQYWQSTDGGRALAPPTAELDPVSQEAIVVERRSTVLSPWVTLTERVVRFAAQHAPQTYHSFAQADYVSLLAQTKDGQIVMVRQFRPAMEASTLELPGGTVDAGEDPEICAVRELEEETGYRVLRPPVFLGKIAPDVGRLDNMLWAYWASEVEPIPGWEPEPLVERVLLSREAFIRVAAAGEMYNAGHLALFALAQAQGHF